MSDIELSRSVAHRLSMAQPLLDPGHDDDILHLYQRALTPVRRTALGGVREARINVRWRQRRMDRGWRGSLDVDSGCAAHPLDPEIDPPYDADDPDGVASVKGRSKTKRVSEESSYG